MTISKHNLMTAILKVTSEKRHQCCVAMTLTRSVWSEIEERMDGCC